MSGFDLDIISQTFVSDPLKMCIFKFLNPVYTSLFEIKIYKYLHAI